MNRIFAIILISLFFIACQPKGRVYVKHKALSPNIEWLKKDKREFKLPIDDVNLTYNLSIAFRYANGYQFQVAKIKVTEKSPSGKELVYEYNLKVREDNGSYIGEPGFDIWDSEHLVESGKKYSEVGTYKYIVEHIMTKDPLYYAMEIGIVLDLLEAR